MDPNFTGMGRVITDEEGRYEFVTVRPAAYPWGNHDNAWRPSHIHLSLLGPAFATRLVTQMYFPDEPLIPLNPIACAVPVRRCAGAGDLGANDWWLRLGRRRPPSPPNGRGGLSIEVHADAPPVP